MSEQPLFHVLVEFQTIVDCDAFHAKRAVIRRKLAPVCHSIQDANKLVWYVFGDDNGHVSVQSAYLQGANEAGRRYLEEAQIGWEGGEFVDLEVHHDI